MALCRICKDAKNKQEKLPFKYLFLEAVSFPSSEAYLQLMTRLLEVPSRQLMQTQVK